MGPLVCVCVWIWTREGSVNIRFRVRTAVIGECRVLAGVGEVGVGSETGCMKKKFSGVLRGA